MEWPPATSIERGGKKIDFRCVSTEGVSTVGYAAGYDAGMPLRVQLLEEDRPVRELERRDVPDTGQRILSVNLWEAVTSWNATLWNLMAIR